MAVAERVRDADGTFLSRGDGIGENRWEHPVYRAWSSMKTRCTNETRWNFDRYGGRGITVDPRWDDYAEFHSDMFEGYFPGASLERIDNDGDYTPENCRWATLVEQANNKRNNRLLTYKGESKTLAQWSRDTGIKSNTIRQRHFVYGWTIERSLETPVLTRGVE